MKKNTGLMLSEVRGLLNNLNDNLSGEYGDYWLKTLKKMLRKEKLPELKHHGYSSPQPYEKRRLRLCRSLPPANLALTRWLVCPSGCIKYLVFLRLRKAALSTWTGRLLWCGTGYREAKNLSRMRKRRPARLLASNGKK